MFRWRWDREEDEAQSRGLTRRTFLSLSGMAGLFAVTAPLHGLAIAERGPIEVVTEAMFVGREPFDLRRIDGVLRAAYEPLVAASINRQPILFDWMKDEPRVLGHVRLTAEELQATKYAKPGDYWKKGA